MFITCVLGGIFFIMTLALIIVEIVDEYYNM